MPADSDQQNIIVLGGGCFWCVEAVFAELAGIRSIEPGYTGGHVDHPTYEQVCDKRTGHIEVARIEFDSAVLSLPDLLTIFFATHDPTTIDRQGNDVGPQYASAVFYASEAQHQTALEVIRGLEEQSVFNQPIVTQVRPLEHFWPAEDYHRDYYARHPDQGYCQFVISPKVAKVRQAFADRLKGSR